MNIGAAIKSLKKGKEISQKDFAQKCGLSVNALFQIENDITFPQKKTTMSIVEALEIPVSYLLFFAISDQDVLDEKRPAFNPLFLRGFE